MYEYKARVARVVDGDTVDFDVDLGFGVLIRIRTRLAGVDTPERGHPDFAMATEFCYKLLFNMADTPKDDEEIWVTIKTHKTGKYGRWIAEIDGVTDVLARKWPYER